MPPAKPAPIPEALIEWAHGARKAAPILLMMEEKLRNRRRRRLKKGVAVASLFLILAPGYWAVSLLRDTGRVATPTAHTQSFTLADGSLAELNAHTELQTDFRYGHRTVRLTEGEAYFSVQKDPAHPFLVQTPNGTIRVTGTKFNVRLSPEGSAVVTMAEGSVSVRLPGNTDIPDIKLGSRDELSLDASGAHTRILSAEQLENELSWRSGYLALDGLSLADAAARFASFHGRVIQVSPEAASLRLGGSCPLASLPNFLDFIRQSAGVQVISNPDGSCLITKR